MKCFSSTSQEPHEGILYGPTLRPPVHWELGVVMPNEVDHRMLRLISLAVIVFLLLWKN